MIDLYCSANQRNRCRETMTQEVVTSYSSRPLRRPLSASASFPPYGKVSLKHSAKTVRASLTMFPSARYDVREQVPSSSPKQYNCSRDTRDSRVAQSREAALDRLLRMRAPAAHTMTKSHSKTTTTTAATPSKKKQLQQNNPEREAALDRLLRMGAPAHMMTKSHSTAVSPPKTKPILKNYLDRDPRSRTVATEKTAKRKVRFQNVQVYYYDEQQLSSLRLASLLGGVVTMRIEDYERQRGPPRPFRFFLKSRTELRRIKRLQRIQDNIAEEEWKAIRQQQEATVPMDDDSAVSRRSLLPTDQVGSHSQPEVVMKKIMSTNRLAFLCKCRRWTNWVTNNR